MLTVVKRSGASEPFDAAKIRNSLAATSDEMKEPLNDADLRIIVNYVEQMLQERTVITSRQLYTMICGVLYANKFFDLLEAYARSEENAWKG